ncbi:MAG: c-type cytochrome, partial [Planctomycetes bacterium]|nr:c-type cytochrome [Planctomycetota bacterium]
MFRILATAIITLFLTAVALANPGLIAVYSDGEHIVHRVVPTPNFTLAANESVHSQIAPKFDAVITGVLKVRRGGEYAISGDARIEVDNKQVAGKILKLSAGDHALKIIYKRKAGPVRLQLRWKSDFFVEEPIPPAAFGHEHAGDALTQQWTRIEQGRLLYENLSCGACHGADAWNLSVRKGPHLSDIGTRVTTDWLYTWLKNPRHYRKTAVMPVLLSDEDQIRDVTAYLAQLVESPVGGADSARNAERTLAGKEIYDRVGCNKCHSETQHSLASVGSKFSSSRALATFLADPLHVDPSGRMPQMFDPKTQASEAELVAEFLFHSKKTNDGWPKFPGGDVKRGRELVQSRGCNSCHSVKESGELLPDKMKTPQFTAPGVRFDPNKGCLAAVPAKGTPNYQLSAKDRSSLQAFMKSVAEHPIVAVAPVETFYRRVRQFNCTACHALNDQNNGPRREITDEGKVVAIERPPSLTAAGDKLRTSWIRGVLLDKKRTRPWMNMRMPHFGSELAQLPALFPTASGSTGKDETPAPNLDLAKAGLKTIGVQRGETACINCHNYRSI